MHYSIDNVIVCFMDSYDALCLSSWDFEALTDINYKVLLHICLVRMIIIPILFRRAHDFPKFLQGVSDRAENETWMFCPHRSPAPLSKLTGKCVDFCKIYMKLFQFSVISSCRN